MDHRKEQHDYKSAEAVNREVRPIEKAAVDESLFRQGAIGDLAKVSEERIQEEINDYRIQVFRHDYKLSERREIVTQIQIWTGCSPIDILYVKINLNCDFHD